ncbi:pilus assembly protein [Halalkalibacillus sediminis]|uniref:Pilus assembly protein n=1 Tax=Halalkalibacillus sediminis TaxID=2018042 RepID=A0A2I0QRI6_9BACI|nr:prepilin-type N-terminal cleavage/methylation domain-containing protein [Halalkalibacillus sediminis]PKR76942.1 pilus assembly protein [Halalkalibacillus sediminis]
MLGQVRRLFKNQKGVTLVELLAVIIILGIIALIAVPAIASVIDDSRVDSINASAINYINAAELYKVTNDGSLPSSETDLADYINEKDGISFSGVTFDENTDGEITISGTGTYSGGGPSVTYSNETVSDISDR